MRLYGTATTCAAIAAESVRIDDLAVASTPMCPP